MTEKEQLLKLYDIYNDLNSLFSGTSDFEKYKKIMDYISIMYLKQNNFDINKFKIQEEPILYTIDLSDISQKVFIEFVSPQTKLTTNLTYEDLNPSDDIITQPEINKPIVICTEPPLTPISIGQIEQGSKKHKLHDMLKILDLYIK